MYNLNDTLMITVMMIYLQYHVLVRRSYLQYHVLVRRSHSTLRTASHITQEVNR